VQSLLSEAQAGRHFAQFHHRPDALADSAFEFLEAGLRRGNSVVVLATPANVERFMTRLERGRFRASALRHAGQLTFHDAQELLDAIVVNGMPAWSKFRVVMGGILDGVRAFGRGTRVYGDTAGMLSGRGARWGGGAHEALRHAERLAHHQVGREPRRRREGSMGALDQRFGGAHPDVGVRHGHGGQARVADRGLRDVVEADHADVLGHADPGRPQGIERLGGIDFDEAVVTHVRRTMGDAIALLDSNEPASRSALARLRQECVTAKETLSSDSDATIAVLLPNVQTEVRITRSELEDMIRPLLRETLDSTRRAMESAGVQVADVKAVLLAGGSSRIPLVGEMVRSELGRPVVTDSHPKHSVALGAAHVPPRPAVV